MPLNRDATIEEAKNHWLTACADDLIYAYRSNELTGEGGIVNVSP